jgi:transposase
MGHVTTSNQPNKCDLASDNAADPLTAQSMPPPLSVDLKERIIKWYFEDGLTYCDICNQSRVSLGLISNTIRNYQECGGHPFWCITEQPSYLNDQDMAFIQSTLDANPSIYLDELQKQLNDTQNIEVSIATLSHMLKSLEHSRKSLTKVSAE